VARRLHWLGISVALVACVALGCEGGDKTPAGETAPTAEESGAQKPAEGVWQTSVPENFPPDVPRYPGAAVASARQTPENGFVADFTTADPPEKVVTYFTDSFAADGWATRRVDAEDGVMVFADKGQRMTSVGVSPGEGKTRIQMLMVEMP
jgi:hypothetical protein